jgi:type IV pilus assembly protein PilV
MKTRLPTRSVRRQRGVGLIEVMVSILVVSIGLFGAAALQTSALRNNQGAYERTQVTILAQGMLDAMRSNIAGVDGGQYEMAEWTCAAPDAGSLARNDRARWIGDIQTQLNSAACGRITCAARVCTVGVRWDDSRSNGGSNAQVVQLQGRLR